MKIVATKPVLTCVLLLLGSIVAGITAVHAEEPSKYGIYSNMESVEGEISGFEFFLLPSNEGDFLLFQQAEGWPAAPLLLKVRLGGTTSADNDLIQFTHPEMGPFQGRITAEGLTGEFTQMKYEIKLTRGQSIWQSPR